MCIETWKQGRWLLPTFCCLTKPEWDTKCVPQGTLCARGQSGRTVAQQLARRGWWNLLDAFSSTNSMWKFLRRETFCSIENLIRDLLGNILYFFLESLTVNHVDQTSGKKEKKCKRTARKVMQWKSAQCFMHIAMKRKTFELPRLRFVLVKYLVSYPFMTWHIDYAQTSTLWEKHQSMSYKKGNFKQEAVQDITGRGVQFLLQHLLDLSFLAFFAQRFFDIWEKQRALMGATATFKDGSFVCLSGRKSTKLLWNHQLLGRICLVSLEKKMKTHTSSPISGWTLSVTVFAKHKNKTDLFCFYFIRPVVLLGWRVWSLVLSINQLWKKIISFFVVYLTQGWRKKKKKTRPKFEMIRCLPVSTRGFSRNRRDQPTRRNGL